MLSLVHFLSCSCAFSVHTVAGCAPVSYMSRILRKEKQKAGMILIIVIKDAYNTLRSFFLVSTCLKAL